MQNKTKINFIAPSRGRLLSLLANGYFPSELPPPFRTKQFAEHSIELASKWDGKDIRKFWSKPERFSSPRHGHARRSLSIVNPVNQLHVSDLLSLNWYAVRIKLQQSKTSEFRPRILIKSNGRAVTGVDFDGVHRRRTELLAKFGNYVKTDIARFYPSIYTHSIAWALLGKEYCKTNHKSKAFRESFANKLDAAVTAGQEGQTMGIPIGPDTSRVISELVAVEIENEVRLGIPDWDARSVRYVDDMLIGFAETESDANFISSLSSALHAYELEINASKTEVFGLGRPHAPEWSHYIRSFRINNRSSRQREDLDSYFGNALHLAEANPQDNVLLYACKRAISFPIDESNSAHFVRWLIYLCRTAPICLKFVAGRLASDPPKEELVNSEIKDFIIQQIPQKAKAAHTEELSWLLFWAREISINIPSEVLAPVLNLRSSVVALVALDIKDSGNIGGQIDEGFWKSFTNEAGLKSEMWLVAYEATKKGWWASAQSDSFLRDHRFFADIYDRDIEFYERQRKAKPRPFSVFATLWADAKAMADSKHDDFENSWYSF